MSKQVHPFEDAKDIPNAFYFLNTTPSRYDASDYFRTFRDLRASRKHAMHDYWKRAINILIASSSFTYKKAGNRLLAVWKSPEKGLRGFWAQQEQLESAQDDLQATTTMVRKRSYRSVRHQLFQAFNAVDDNTIYDGRSSKRRVRSAGVTGGDEAAGGEEKHRQEEEQQVDEEKDEGDEEDEEEQGDDGDESEESASQSSEGSEYLPGGAKLQPAIAPASVYYLTGNGSTDCSKKLWTPWINNGEDLAGKVWAYREAICLKAQKLEPLSGSVEKLAINHVYLFDRKDTSSGLYDAIGAAHWAAITSTSLKRLLPKDVIADVASYALDLAQLSYSDAQDSVLDHEGNRDVRKVLNYLLADDFLWKGADYNELELVQHIFDPFLKTFISNIQGSVGPWDKVFQPSQERKKDALAEGRGRRPDFFPAVRFP
ncbi:hypothetical protein EDD21DRAFT_390533 [Dissophora ornata]|nr:hypothetical protein EDD21DRAFT_390533 [Dissophora ornata]